MGNRYVVPISFLGIVLFMVPGCTNGAILLACHGDSLRLHCPEPETMIVVESANYGRTSEYECNGGNTPLLRPCRLASSLAIINARCFGKTRCELTASSSDFADPCPGISKYLQLVYQCTPRSSVFNACETPVLRQPSGYITSPGYPRRYQPTASCKVQFEPGPTNGTQIEILDIELEARVEKGCFDWLILREEDVVWMKHDICGNLMTMGVSSVLVFDKLNLYFRTDGINQYRGFLLKFTAVTSQNLTKILPERHKREVEAARNLTSNKVGHRRPKEVVNGLDPGQGQVNVPGGKPVAQLPMIKDNAANRDMLAFIKKTDNASSALLGRLMGKDRPPMMPPADGRPRPVGLKEAVESMMKNEGGCSEEQARSYLPLHGTLHHFKEGKIFHIRCSSGFKISDEDDAVYVCSRNSWIGAGSATCIPFECPDLPPLAHGQLSLPDTRHGSQAEYRCDPGYRLTGDATRTCLASSQWSGSEPNCKAVQNPPPSQQTVIPIEILLAVAFTLLFFMCKKRLVKISSGMRSKLV